MIVYYPKDKVLTKKDELSNKCFDTTNIEKPLMDLIFLPKYFDLEYPFGCKNLNLDDKFLLDLVSKKRISPDQNHYIKIKLEIVNRDQTLLSDDLNSHI